MIDHSRSAHKLEQRCVIQHGCAHGHDISLRVCLHIYTKFIAFMKWSIIRDPVNERYPHAIYIYIYIYKYIYIYIYIYITVIILIMCKTASYNLIKI